MSTSSPRINIVATEELYSALSFIANLEDKSLSAIAKELLFEALEKREDKFLSDIANKRDTPDAQLISHQEIWGL